MTARTVPSTFVVELHMLSDWHVGAGYGEGEIDRAVLRDECGLPYVPGKTLRGVLRDACEEVVFGLDEGSFGSWRELLDAIFGSQPALQTAAAQGKPRPGLLNISNALYPEALRSAVAERPRLAGASTFTKPGVRVSSRSGRALPRHLRFEEMARLGVRLQSTFALELPDGPNGASSRATFALVLAGLTRLEVLGGKRRRGSGRVAAAIISPGGIELDDVWMAELDQEKAPRAELLRGADTDTLARPGGDWQVVRCELRAESGICASAGTVGNLNTTLDRVPGSALLPALLARLRSLNLDFREAIAAGDLIVTDATPAIDGARGLPVPQCLAHEKTGGGLEDGGDVYNLLMQGDVEGQPKIYRSGYVTAPPNASSAVRYGRTPLAATTHNTIDDDLQRPSAAVGGVYTLEAIAPRTILHFEARMRADIVAALARKREAWWELLEGQWSLGAAKSGGYGVCEVTASAPAPAQSLSAEQSVPNRVTIWLLSDVLLRDERLRPTTDPNAVAAEVGRSIGQEVRVLRAFGQQRRMESWQRSWGLPRPSILGLAAGTCIECEVDAQPDVSLLRELEQEGIGERRAEGFGRVVFNHPLLSSTAFGSAGRPEESAAVSSPMRPIAASDAAAFEVARTIEAAAWRDEIARRALVLADDEQRRREALGLAIVKGQSEPELSQVAALREVLGTVMSAADLSSAVEWLDHLRAVKNRVAKWPLGALDRVDELLHSPQRVWTLLGLDEWAPDLVITEGGRKALEQELWAEAIRAVSDAVCRGHKRAVEQAYTHSNGGA